MSSRHYLLDADVISAQVKTAHWSSGLQGRLARVRNSASPTLTSPFTSSNASSSCNGGMDSSVAVLGV